ncbi:MAG TPA: cupin domain-containing protein [Nitrospiria bacterium]
MFTDSPGQVWSDFIHQNDELLILADGELELEMRGKRIHCEIGEEIVIPAGTSHTVKNIGKTTNRWFFGYKR